MDYLNSAMDTISGNLPQLLGALVVLIIGWLVAKFIASRIGKLIDKNEKIKKMMSKFFGGEEDVKVGKIIMKVIYYILMIFVIVAVFEALGFSLLTQPLNSFLGSIFAFLPQIIGAIILFVIAWIIATVVKLLVVTALNTLKVDQKLSSDPGKKVGITKTIGDILFWFIFLIFLPGILSALSLEGVLQPVQNMLDKILDAFPNIIAAGIIILIGWFIAKTIRSIATRIFASLGVDRLGGEEKSGNMELSAILGTIIYIMILIPVFVSGLDMIGLSVVTVPAMNMMDTVMNFLPNIISAVVIIYIAFFFGKIIGDIVAGIVSKIKFEKILVDIGFLSAEQKDHNIAKHIGSFVKVAIMFFAVLEASNILGFVQLAGMVDQFIVLASQIILGLFIIGIGLYLAQLFASIIKKKQSASSDILAMVAKTVIIFLSMAMGLRQMGIANEIINMAFGFTLGAVALAASIAFGVGGREAAAKLLSKWDKKE